MTGGPAIERPRPPAGPSTRRRTKRRLWFVGAVLVGALVFLLVEGLGSSLDYFNTVDQALAQRASLGTSTFRLEGLVVPGSIERTATGTDFSVSQGSSRVAVHDVGSPPELFQQDIPVVVVGHFAAGGAPLFLGNQIMVKHSANYIASHPGRVRAPNGSLR